MYKGSQWRRWIKPVENVIVSGVEVVVVVRREGLSGLVYASLGGRLWTCSAATKKESVH